MKPKVIHILNRLNIGGIVPQVINTVKLLQDDFEVILLSGMIEASEASAQHLLNGTNIKPKYIPEMQRGIDLSKDYKAYQSIKKIIEQFKPDIVHTHAAKPGAVGRLAAIRAKVPVVLHTFHGHVFHSYFGKLKSRFFLETEKWLAKNSSAVIAISQLQKREMIEDFHLCEADKMKEINYGYDLEKFYTNTFEKRQIFRQQWNLKEDELIIGIIGRVVPIKNHQLFLSAFQKVLAQFPDNVRTLIIGDGEEKNHLQQWCTEQNISFTNQPSQHAKVIFTSWIKDIEHAYAGIDVLALSSLNEGTPISLIEAQAAGLPIVTTDVGGVRDTILENENVLVVKSNDIDSFSDGLNQHICQLKNNDAFDTDVNRRYVLQKFGLEHMGMNIKSLYKELLNKKM